MSPTLAIKRYKRGNRVYLSKYRNWRVNGKVKSVFIRYLGFEENGKIAKALVKTIDKVSSTDSTGSGDIGLLWAVAQDLDIPGIIDRIRH